MAHDGILLENIPQWLRAPSLETGSGLCCSLLLPVMFISRLFDVLELRFPHLILGLLITDYFKEKQPLSSNMIERSVVEAAVQECSQSVDETMYVDKFQFFPVQKCY
ncbi:hypothetical protein FD754_018608 [Muntiacus muntjak]|uniref:DNA polymerase epsilon subunit B N-terminal domain-containing protein n=1 Tax=Muntiacus muntjak TaxID=9888 RepID=A0A5N3UXW2_MUNMU|nr:hypothetical protein FD754_018608 [Muntiacus muntjak]